MIMKSLKKLLHGLRRHVLSALTRTRRTSDVRRKEKEEQFEFVVKMAVIIKELMNGCDKLDPLVL